MTRMEEAKHPVKLTQAQRKAVAEIAPDLVERLRLNEKAQRTILFTPAELQAITMRATSEAARAETGAKRNSFRLVSDLAAQALEDSHGIRAIPATERIYQFKITLKGIAPLIWRRIQVRNCTLDMLHECIQTAMGWTNSHLHDFCFFLCHAPAFRLRWGEITTLSRADHVRQAQSAAGDAGAAEQLHQPRPAPRRLQRVDRG